MESKFSGEMEEHKQKLDKEYESTRQNFMLEIEKLKKKMEQDLDKKVGALELSLKMITMFYMTYLNKP